jgi:tRNA (adenine57-N1/adenine58-N1)-methyltransferase
MGAGEQAWREGDVIALKHPGAPAIVLRLRRGPQRIGDAAVVDLSSEIGNSPGGEIDWLGTPYRVLRPSLSDLFSSLTRGAQIITPKDCARIVSLAALAPGDHVVEAGAGTGALTVALAYAVGPTGRVTSIDRRTESLRIARENIDRAGLSDRVTWVERDVVQDGFDRGSADAVILDLPEPWSVLASAHAALRIGGTVVAYTPTYNQLERTVRGMREHRFDEVQAMEILERSMHVGEGGTRPSFDMLGHTGFLSAGRRVD